MVAFVLLVYKKEGKYFVAEFYKHTDFQKQKGYFAYNRTIPPHLEAAWEEKSSLNWEDLKLKQLPLPFLKEAL